MTVIIRVECFLKKIDLEIYMVEKLLRKRKLSSPPLPSLVDSTETLGKGRRDDQIGHRRHSGKQGPDLIDLRRAIWKDIYFLD